MIELQKVFTYYFEQMTAILHRPHFGIMSDVQLQVKQFFKLKAFLCPRDTLQGVWAMNRAYRFVYSHQLIGQQDLFGQSLAYFTFFQLSQHLCHPIFHRVRRYPVAPHRVCHSIQRTQSHSEL